jgi:hypothetical protein
LTPGPDVKVKTHLNIRTRSEFRPSDFSNNTADICIEILA